MRLLTTSGELRLKTFINEMTRPPYAILSHTWMDDEDEVVFANLANLEEAIKKPGWKKIDCTRQQAREDAHEYVWIDAVCIDKSSSAELSEAINSMFKWYQRSAVCYVYLADMPDPLKQTPGIIDEGFAWTIRQPDDNASSSSKSDEESLLGQPQKYPTKSFGPVLDDKFCQSRWFKRGWTLQEMLAPRAVHFYSADWTFLGTLRQLHGLVTKSTRIQMEYLHGSTSLREASVAKRMSWAAERITTRVEDRAYSLLGIFGVNMPIIYGEGEEAFFRLQYEVFRVTKDQSILAWLDGSRANQASLEYDSAKLEEAGYVHRPEADRLEEHELSMGTGSFARSPDGFRYRGGIVPLQRSQWTSCDVTSTGIRLRLPIYFEEGFPGNGIAMLQCRDISRPGKNCFVPLRFCNYHQVGDEFVLSEIHRDLYIELERVGEEEGWIAQQWPLRNITLLFHKAPSLIDMVKQLKSVGGLDTLLVRSGSARNVSDRFSIGSAEPSEHWSETSHSFSLPDLTETAVTPSLDRGEVIFEALLSIISDGKQHRLCIFLFLSRNVYRFELQFVHGSLPIRPDWQKKDSRSRVMGEEFLGLLHKTHIATAECTLANGNVLEARMWIECVLDQTTVLLLLEEKTQSQAGSSADDEKERSQETISEINETELSLEIPEYFWGPREYCPLRALDVHREYKDDFDKREALALSPICSRKTRIPRVVSFHGRTLQDVYACKFCWDAP